jgi:hypothetical protein
MKRSIKQFLISVFLKLLSQPAIELKIANSHRNFGQKQPEITNLNNPYENFQIANDSQGEGVVFVTGRFRSGSTLLWNVFRKSDDFTAFYEPFNERQWFNPEKRGDRVDKTHRGVEDYWLEYEGFEVLSSFYDEDWIRDMLYMSESAYVPNMRAFIDALIQNSPKRPVLQFNRIDFRLPWLKKQYPLAKFIHLYRNPRDQWCSFLEDKTLMNKDDVHETYKDAFYLDMWCDDLVKHFPFLDRNLSPHPYSRFYYLWKLSYIFGKQYSDISLSYEDFVNNPASSTDSLRSVLDANDSLVDIAEELISVTSIGAWEKYAQPEWFISKERNCELTLSKFSKTLCGSIPIK